MRVLSTDPPEPRPVRERLLLRRTAVSRQKLLRPGLTFRRPAPREVRIQHLERFGARHRSRVGSLGEIHHHRVGVAEGWPFGESLTVGVAALDRKSTRLNSSHLGISY